MANATVTSPVTIGRKITVYRGDVATITFTLGTGFPLTDKTAVFTVKTVGDATTTILSEDCTSTDEAGGVCTYTTAATDFATAGRYAYDVQVADTADGANPQTAMIGTLVVAQDVTT